MFNLTVFIVKILARAITISHMIFFAVHSITTS